MTAAARRARLARIADEARQVAKAERRLDGSLRRARLAGYSIRELEAATGIPRATLARRLADERDRNPHDQGDPIGAEK